MKIATIIFMIFTFFMLMGTGALAGINYFLVQINKAEEIYPPDVINKNDKFELVIGIDKNNNPYYTYHYEFIE